MVTAMLTPAQYQILTIDMPPVPDAELKAAARWRVKDMITVAPEDVTLDVLRLPGLGGASGRQVLVVVSPNEAIRQTMLKCRSAGLALSAIDIPELGLRNLACVPGVTTGAVATLVDAGVECWLSVCDGGELLAVRRFPHDGSTGVTERVVTEVRRSIDRVERQFQDLRLSMLMIDMGAATPDYLRALTEVTQLSCQPFRPAAQFESGAAQPLACDGDPFMLALAGVSLRDPDPVAA
jgi:MSHA biogenesis protein MshI